MKKSLASFTLAATLSSITTMPLHAEQANTGISFNPGAGYYNFDSELNLEDNEFPSLGIEYRFTERLALEANYMQAEVENENTGNEFDWSQYRLDGIYYFSPQKKLQPFLTAGAGENNFERPAGDAKDTVASLGAGFKYFVNKAFSLRGDLKAINSLDNETTSAAAILGLNIALGGGRTGSRKGDLDLAMSETADTDQDGIFNAQDQCPNTVAGVSVDSQGCPLDADSDGIADYKDSCLNTPAGTIVGADGCLADQDLDGIADASDACPNTDQDLMVDDKGCPIKIEKTVSMDLDVNFPLNSADLPEEFYSDVKELATFMKLYSDTVAVIEGHADATGPEDFNKTLSEQRAKTIKSILTKDFGIDPNRLKPVGFGEEKPIATNETEQGRRKNRRAATKVNTVISVSQPAN